MDKKPDSVSLLKKIGGNCKDLSYDVAAEKAATIVAACVVSVRLVKVQTNTYFLKKIDEFDFVMNI